MGKYFFIYLFIILMTSSFSINALELNNSNITNQNYGSLYITTIPNGAEIYVDDVYRGISPLRIDNIIIGTRLIKSIKSGYDNSYSYSIVYSNKITNMNIGLIPAIKVSDINSENITKSPSSNMWIVWILLIIVVAFLIVFWVWKKGHIKQPKIPPQKK